MKPLLKIQGSKNKLSDWIIEHINNTWDGDGVYFEPFMGCGIVGMKLLPKKAVFSDLNKDIANYFNYIQKNSITEVANFLMEHGWYLNKQGESYYYKVRERFNEDKSPMDFLFLNRTCFNGVMRYNKSGDFNTPYCNINGKLNPKYISDITIAISLFQELCKKSKWLFTARSYIDVIAKAKENDFIYCDPPYAGRETQYTHKWGDGEEEAFHIAMGELKCKWAISSWLKSNNGDQSKKNKYIELWQKDYKVYRKAHAYTVGPNKNTRPKIIEALVLNV